MAETETEFAPVVSYTTTINGDQNPAVADTTTKQYRWWIQMIVYSVFVLAGQTTGTLLSRLYFNNGGSSQWLCSLIQLCGFPILIPFRFLKTPAHRRLPIPIQVEKFPIILTLIYIAIGILTSGVTLLYAVGVNYLPVSTYALIYSTQLGFNAFFSYFLNAQKFTPYIVNSLLLLTVSSVLLVFNPENEGTNASSSSKNKHALGFVCTVAGSAGAGFALAATQLTFRKIIKKESIAAIIDMSVCESLVATMVIAVGFLARWDWRNVSSEMRGYKHGTTAYVMTLFWMAVSWQVFTVGCVGLIFKVSALFSNAIMTVGTPLVPVTAVVLFGEKMTGVKGVSMVLATWGFVSYMYQHYRDDLEMKKTMTKREGDEEAMAFGTS